MALISFFSKCSSEYCHQQPPKTTCTRSVRYLSCNKIVSVFMQSMREGDETASNASTAASNTHQSSVSSWMINVQRRLLRAVPSVVPTSKRPKLHSPIILRALTDLPAPTKAPLSEPAYRNCDNRLEPAIQRPDRRRSSIAKM